MQAFRRMVADNLITLRTAAGMTQSDLGEKLNYSDKSISKWERAEALPDVYVLKQISEIFHVSVDYLLTPHAGEELPPETEPAKERRSRKSIITAIAVAGVLALAMLIFVVTWILYKPVFMIFVYTLPVVIIVLIVLGSIWQGGRYNIPLISLLVWSILLTIYLTLRVTGAGNNWQLFLLGIPAQIVVILCYILQVKFRKARAKAIPKNNS